MRRAAIAGIFVLLLAASHLTQFATRTPPPASPAPPDLQFFDGPAFDADGPIPGRSARLAWRRFTPDPDPARPPLVLLHGSPGSKDDFALLAQLLAADGRDILAPDLPGFGASAFPAASYDARAHAHALIAWLDDIGVRRFHVLGWSMGGAVALQAADILSARAEPDRVASITLLAAVGAMPNEGSGDYFFEQAKYTLGLATLGYAAEAVPHFGILGPHALRVAFLRNFLDTDLRRNEPVMAVLATPTLIIHGRHDILIAERAAHDHHRRIPQSSLVILDANHFLPFLQPRETADALAPFLARHDTPGTPATPAVVDVGGPRRGFNAIEPALAPIVRAVPWHAHAAVLAVVAAIAPPLAVLVAAIFTDAMLVDFGVAAFGLAIGLFARTLACWAVGRVWPACARELRLVGVHLPEVSHPDWTRRFDRGTFLHAFASTLVPADRDEFPLAAGTLRRGTLGVLLARPLACFLWALLALTPAFLATTALAPPLFRAMGSFGLALAAVPALALGLLLPRLATRRGRQRLRRRASRIIHHEYWLASLFYAPLVPLLWRHVTRMGRLDRVLMLPTAVNPGIENGGGFVGESKSAIMRRLFEGARSRPDLAALLSPTILIERSASTDRDLLALDAALRQHALAYPVILKPDSGQRGFGVRLVRSRADAERYFADLTGPVIAQPYHPGPEECGIVWARSRSPRPDGLTGSIFSVTRKQFPVLIGNGKSTIEDLVWAHRRFRRQAPTFLERLRHERSRVPASGERVPLAVSGNHCQGTLFRDGSDLITPALEAAIDALARNFGAGPPGALLDFGRFDLRFSSEHDLRQGRGFTVIELNGALGESTNLYDPDRSVFWAYAVLVRQWKLLYDLGLDRRNAGGKPLSFAELMRRIRGYYRARRGPALSD